MNKITKKLVQIWRAISIEPAYFLFMLCHGFYGIVAQSLYIDKVCRVNLAYGKEICDNIQQNEEEQIEVQRYVSALQAYNAVLQALPGVIYSQFAGPWSDKYGRKGLMAFACFGYVFNNAVFMLNTYFFDELKAEYLLFECLQDFTGGSTMFFLTCYSYLADVTTPESRTKRFAFLDGLWPIAYFSGMFFAGIIKKELGYMYNYSLGMLTSVLAMAYILVIVKDSRKLREARLAKEKEKNPELLEALNPSAAGNFQDKNSSSQKTTTEDTKNDDNSSSSGQRSQKNSCLALFDLSNLKDGWMTVLKKRPHHQRTLLILAIVVFELEMFIIIGKWSNSYLYFRKALKWTIVEYSRYTTALGLVGVGAQYILMPIFKDYLKMRDTTILMVTVVGCIVNHFVMAFATAEWQLYVGMCFSVMAFCATTLCRSMISQFVKPDEVGKVFAITGAIQALMPFAANPTFGFLYRSTVATFPQAYLFMVIGIYFFLLALIVVVHWVQKRVEKSMQESNEKNAQ